MNDAAVNVPVQFLCGRRFPVLSGTFLGVDSRGCTCVHECVRGPGVRVVLAAGSLLCRRDQGKGFCHLGAEWPEKGVARVEAIIRGRGQSYLGCWREARPCFVVLVCWCANTLVRRPSYPGFSFVAQVPWSLPPGPQTCIFLLPPLCPGLGPPARHDLSFALCIF